MSYRKASSGRNTPPSFSFVRIASIDLVGLLVPEHESIDPTPPGTIRKGGLLELLELSWLWSKVIRSVARCGITSRKVDIVAGDTTSENSCGLFGDTSRVDVLRYVVIVKLQCGSDTDEFTRCTLSHI